MLLYEVKPWWLCGHMSRLKYSTGSFTQSFAAALVRSELIALNAPALERPFCVGTALAAVALFSTLVHIWKRQVKKKKKKAHIRTRSSFHIWGLNYILTTPQKSRQTYPADKLHKIGQQAGRLFQNRIYTTSKSVISWSEIRIYHINVYDHNNYKLCREHKWGRLKFVHSILKFLYYI